MAFSLLSCLCSFFWCNNLIVREANTLLFHGLSRIYKDKYMKDD